MKKYLLVILVGLFHPVLKAQEQLEINRFYQESRQQKESGRLEQQRLQLSQRRYQAVSDIAENVSENTACLPYSELYFRGVNAIDHRPFVLKESCINEVKLNQISREITRAYLNKGIIHTPFHFDTSGNRLVMVVNEGRIARMETNSKRVNLDTLLPNKRGSVVKIQDLDQALDNANMMKGSRVTLDVLPEKNGDVTLKWVNQEERRIKGEVELNNFASKSYQRWQNRIVLSVDSPLGLSDVLNLNITHTLKGFSQFSRSLSLAHSIPYGYWRFNLQGSLAQFKQQITLPNNQIEQQGRTIQAGGGVDYVAMRGKNFVTTLSGKVEHINSKNRFAESVLRVQSPRLSAYQIGINHLQLFPNGAVNGSIFYKQGTSWFNALSNQGSDQPEGDYAKWQAEVYFQHYHHIGEQVFRQHHRLSAHYSQNYLPAIEQADLTGRNAVRGIRDNTFSAEQNIVLRNQLDWLTSWQALDISPYVGWDIGFARTSDSQSPHQQARGYVIGLNVSSPQNWNALVEWASGRLKGTRGTPSLKDNGLDASIQLVF